MFFENISYGRSSTRRISCYTIIELNLKHFFFVHFIMITKQFIMWAITFIKQLSVSMNFLELLEETLVKHCEW